MGEGARKLLMLGELTERAKENALHFLGQKA
jgi:hypothetical protein